MNEKDQDELNRLRVLLHSRCSHPDYEYGSTHGQRKMFDSTITPIGEVWERNVDVGRSGWERFDYHEEAYWRRRRAS